MKEVSTESRKLLFCTGSVVTVMCLHSFLRPHLLRGDRIYQKMDIKRGMQKIIKNEEGCQNGGGH